MLEVRYQAFLFFWVGLHVGVHDEVAKAPFGLDEAEEAKFSQLVVSKLLQQKQVVHVVAGLHLLELLDLRDALDCTLSVLALADVLLERLLDLVKD